MKITGYVRKELLRYKKNAIMLILLQLFEFASMTALPYVTGLFVDNLSVGRTEGQKRLIAIFAGLAVISILARYYATVVRNQYKERVAANLNETVIEYLHQAPVLKLQEKDASFLSNQISMDSELSVALITDFLLVIIVSIVTILTAAGIVVSISLPAILPMVVLILVYVALYFAFQKPISRKTMEFRNAQSRFFADQTEQLAKTKLIRANSARDFFHRRTVASTERLVEKCGAQIRVSMQFEQATTLLNQIATVTLFLIALVLVADGKMTIGDFVIINSYYAMILSETSGLAEALSYYRSTHASLERLEDLFDMGQEPEGTQILKGIHSVEISQLSFSYGKAEDAESKEIFSDYNLRLEQGNVYFLKGTNGKGKSTLLQILSGIYLGYQGRVCYDGVELREINREDARKRVIAFTQQEPLTVQGSLRDNMTLGFEAQVPDEEIFRLMKEFGMSDFLAKQEQGLDTRLGASEALSGGEKQKLSIIRTLLKNADFCIFDEPTSALDIASVQVFKQMISEIKQNKIILIVTHDESIQDLCDREIVL